MKHGRTQFEFYVKKFFITLNVNQWHEVFICEVATKYQSEFTEKGYYEIEIVDASVGVHVIYTLHYKFLFMQ